MWKGSAPGLVFWKLILITALQSPMQHWAMFLSFSNTLKYFQNFDVTFALFTNLPNWLVSILHESLESENSSLTLDILMEDIDELELKDDERDILSLSVVTVLSIGQFCSDNFFIIFCRRNSIFFATFFFLSHQKEEKKRDSLNKINLQSISRFAFKISTRKKF